MPVESFLVVHLDSKNRMVGMTTCSIGSMTASLVHPRDVFRPAIANMTAGLISFTTTHLETRRRAMRTYRLLAGSLKWARWWGFGAWITLL